jgi:hypothetical protein
MSDDGLKQNAAEKGRRPEWQLDVPLCFSGTAARQGAGHAFTKQFFYISLKTQW